MPGHTKNANSCVMHARALSEPRDKAMASSQRECWLLVDSYLVYFDWKVQRFCWPNGTLLECTESIYVKTMEAVCVSEGYA